MTTPAEDMDPKALEERIARKLASADLGEATAESFTLKQLGARGYMRSARIAIRECNNLLSAQRSEATGLEDGVAELERGVILAAIRFVVEYRKPPMQSKLVAAKEGLMAAVDALTGTGDDVLADRGPNELALAYALRDFIYETTHLSPPQDDGSHKCRISAATLAKGREAIDAFEWQDIHDAGGIFQEERAALLAKDKEQTMESYDKLKAQKDAILAEEQGAILAALKKGREYIAAVDAQMAFTAPENRLTRPDLEMMDHAIASLSSAAPTDGWIEWTGGAQPVSDNQQVFVLLRNGTRTDEPLSAMSWGWWHDPKTADTDIIAYRLATAGEGGR